MIAVGKTAGIELSPHDLRRTFDDIAAHLKIDGDVRRQLLNHLSNDVHGRHYANNPDPKALVGALTAIHDWIDGQGQLP